MENARASRVRLYTRLPCREKRIRTLGWDALDVTPEVLVASIGDALTQLNHTFEVCAGASVVIMPGKEERHRAGGDGLVVQFMLQRSEADLLCLDIRRLCGDSFRFHALYRDFRRAMASVNGWSEAHQEYVPRLSVGGAAAQGAPRPAASADHAPPPPLSTSTIGQRRYMSIPSNLHMLGTVAGFAAASHCHPISSSLADVDMTEMLSAEGAPATADHTPLSPISPSRSQRRSTPP